MVPRTPEQYSFSMIHRAGKQIFKQSRRLSLYRLKSREAAASFLLIGE
jgi:hypothetical protein